MEHRAKDIFVHETYESERRRKPIICFTTPMLYALCPLLIA